MTLKPGRYRHFKGKDYHVLGVARHSETGEDMVIYRPLYGEKALWVRPLSMFVEQVEHEGRRQPRFARLPDQPGKSEAPARAPQPAARSASPSPSPAGVAGKTSAPGVAAGAGVRVFEVNGREYQRLEDVPENEQAMVHRALARASAAGEDPGERLVVSLNPADFKEDKPDFSHVRIIETTRGWVILGVVVTVLLLLLWLW